MVTSFSYIISSYILFLHIAVNCRYIRSQFSQTFVGWLSPIPLSTDLSQGKINQSLGREGGFLSWRNCISFFSECGFLFFRCLNPIQEIHICMSYIFYFAFLRKFYVGNFSQGSILAFVMVDMATTWVILVNTEYLQWFQCSKQVPFFDFNIKNWLGGVGWGSSEQTAYSTINIKIYLSQFISLSNPSQLTYLWLFCFPLLFF